MVTFLHVTTSHDLALRSINKPQQDENLTDEEKHDFTFDFN